MRVGGDQIDAEERHLHLGGDGHPVPVLLADGVSEVGEAVDGHVLQEREVRHLVRALIHVARRDELHAVQPDDALVPELEQRHALHNLATVTVGMVPRVDRAGVGGGGGERAVAVDRDATGGSTVVQRCVELLTEVLEARDGLVAVPLEDESTVASDEGTDLAGAPRSALSGQAGGHVVVLCGALQRGTKLVTGGGVLPTLARAALLRRAVGHVDRVRELEEVVQGGLALRERGQARLDRLPLQLSLRDVEALVGDARGERARPRYLAAVLPRHVGHDDAVLVCDDLVRVQHGDQAVGANLAALCEAAEHRLQGCAASTRVIRNVQSAGAGHRLVHDLVEVGGQQQAAVQVAGLVGDRDRHAARRELPHHGVQLGTPLQRVGVEGVEADVHDVTVNRRVALVLVGTRVADALHTVQHTLGATTLHLLVVVAVGPGRRSGSRL